MIRVTWWFHANSITHVFSFLSTFAERTSGLGGDFGFTSVSPIKDSGASGGVLVPLAERNRTPVES